MIVITLSNCPPKLRGDLTKWLFEVSTNVFVGRVNPRVRDNLWERVKDNCKSGQATMVYGTKNEQHFDFRVHNSEWVPIDLDGIKVMLRPEDHDASNNLMPGYSKASKYLKIKRATHTVNPSYGKKYQRYVVIKIETTGLLPQKDKILSLSTIRVDGGVAVDSFTAIINVDKKIPSKITEMPGIIDELVQNKGEALEHALPAFLKFVDNDVIISHNIGFNMDFISIACQKCNIMMPRNKTEDTLQISKGILYNLDSHTLSRLKEYYDIDVSNHKGPLADCYATMELYEKLSMSK